MPPKRAVTDGGKRLIDLGISKGKFAQENLSTEQFDRVSSEGACRSIEAIIGYMREGDEADAAVDVDEAFDIAVNCSDSYHDAFLALPRIIDDHLDIIRTAGGINKFVEKLAAMRGRPEEGGEPELDDIIEAVVGQVQTDDAGEYATAITGQSEESTES